MRLAYMPDTHFGAMIKRFRVTGKSPRRRINSLKKHRPPKGWVLTASGYPNAMLAPKHFFPRLWCWPLP